MIDVPVVTITDAPGWHSFAVGTLHGLVAAEHAADLAELRAAAEGSVDDVLDVLSRGGIRAMPDFVLVSAPEGSPAQVVCRGTAHAVVTGPDGEREVRAGARGPWTEEDLADDDQQVRLESGAAVPAPVEQPSMPTPAAGGWKVPSRFGRRAGSSTTETPSTTQTPSTTGATSAASVPVPDPMPGPAPGPTPPSGPTPPPVPLPQPQPEPAGAAPETPAASAAPAAPSAGSDAGAAPEHTTPPPPTSASLTIAQTEEKEALPSYDHLFGITAHAVPSEIERVEEPEEHDDAPAAIPARPASAAPSELTMPPPPDDPPLAIRPEHQSPAPAPAPPSGGGLIASVPWATGGSTAPPAASPPAQPVPPVPARPTYAAPPTTPSPQPQPQPTPVVPPRPSAPSAPLTAPAPARPLVEEPSSRTAEQAAQPALVPSAAGVAVPPAPAVVPVAPGLPGATPPATPAQQAAGTAGEEVEMTIDRRALAAAAAVKDSGPLVLSVLCPAGHASSPHSTKCRTCGRDIPPQQAFMTPRPPLGVLRLSTGDVVSLDRGVLFGRSPKVNADLAVADRPHLVKLPSPDKDISRNHVEVVLDGWYVLVRDLGSVNGTTVTLPGEQPLRLRPSDQQGVEPGTVVTIADAVSFTYEVPG